MPEQLLNTMPPLLNQLLMVLLMVLYVVCGVVISLISDIVGNKTHPIDITLRIFFAPANLVFNLIVKILIR
jgi:uncharacterized membrane protein (DUF485 family)